MARLIYKLHWLEKYYNLTCLFGQVFLLSAIAQYLFISIQYHQIWFNNKYVFC